MQKIKVIMIILGIELTPKLLFYLFFSERKWASATTECHLYTVLNKM